jgi:thiamine-monophosphate kinase
MIDISDGLASEVLHICEESGKGAAIYEEKIPVDTVTVSMAEELKIDPTTAALNGGEDYELLFTVSQSDFEKMKHISGITPVGHITEAGANLVTRGGSLVPLIAQGWDAFMKK